MNKGQIILSPEYLRDILHLPEHINIIGCFGEETCLGRIKIIIEGNSLQHQGSGEEPICYNLQELWSNL